MAKNIRIVPTSGSIYFKGDGFNIEGSLQLKVVGDTEDIQFLNGENNESILLINKSNHRISIGSPSASAKLDISSQDNEDLLLIHTPNSGIKVNNEGVLQFLEYDGIPTIVSGGFYYSASNFFIGI